MEEATVNFKAYKAERVIRYRNAPLLPANLFSGVVIGGFLGWVLRRLGCIKEEDFPLEAGWCQRTAFYFDEPDFQPAAEDIKKAEKVPSLYCPYPIFHALTFAYEL